jgi:hypothetical protein
MKTRNCETKSEPERERGDEDRDREQHDEPGRPDAFVSRRAGQEVRQGERPADRGDREADEEPGRDAIVRLHGYLDQPSALSRLPSTGAIRPRGICDYKYEQTREGGAERENRARHP